MVDPKPGDGTPRETRQCPPCGCAAFAALGNPASLAGARAKGEERSAHISAAV